MGKEMRKFSQNTAVRVLLTLTLVLALAVPLFLIVTHTSYTYATEKETAGRGLTGFRHKKQELVKSAGALTTRKLNAALKLYKSQPETEPPVFKAEARYPTLVGLLREAYAPYAGADSFQLSGVSQADDFYVRRVRKIKEKMQFCGMSDRPAIEKRTALQQARAQTEPFALAFTDQWPLLFQSLAVIFPLLALTAVLIGSQLFSYEKEQDMDLILNAAGPKKLTRIGLKKLLAMLIFISLAFIAASLIVTVLVLGLLGTSGGNSPLQVRPEYLTCAYPLTFGQTFLAILLIAWLAILSMAVVSALTNALCQNTYMTLILSALLLVPAVFLKSLSFLPLSFRRFLYTQPVNGLFPQSYLAVFFNYRVGAVRVMDAGMILLLAGAVVVVCLLLVPRLSAKRLHE